MPFQYLVCVVAALLRALLPAEEQVGIPVQETGGMGNPVENGGSVAQEHEEHH